MTDGAIAQSCSTDSGSDQPGASDTSSAEREAARERKREKRRAKKRRAREKRLREARLLPAPQPDLPPEPELEPTPEPDDSTRVDKGGGNCHPSYKGDCLDPEASDYDCAGGSGNGPEYANGPITVTGSDPYDLDRDGDGTACES